MPKRAFVPPHPDTQPDAPTEQDSPATQATTGPEQAVPAPSTPPAPTDEPASDQATQQVLPERLPPTLEPTPPSGSPAPDTDPPTQRLPQPPPAPHQPVPYQPGWQPPAPQAPHPGAPAQQGPGRPVPHHPVPPFLAGPSPGAGVRSASELTDFTIVRARTDTPTSGWRRAVFAISGGIVNPGIGPAQKLRQDRIARIQRPLPGSHFTSVMSLKGGVGKSTVAAMLGLMLSEYRGDRVVGMDANPDAGTLADRLTGDSERSVRDLLDNIDAIRALPDVARFTSLIGRLQVVASQQDPTARTEFDRTGYEQVCGVLSRYYDIIITDSGTGLLHSAMDATLIRASSMVVVGSPTVDGASRASKTLDWLVAHGFAEAVKRAVVVLSSDRTSGEVDVDRLRTHFGKRCRAVVEIPRDPHLAAGGRIDVAQLRPATSDAYLELAALVADEFGSPPPQRTSS